MHILATSGGFRRTKRYGFSVGPVLQHAISLSRNPAAPKICILETAIGDNAAYYTSCYAALTHDVPNVSASHLALFPMPNLDDIREHLLAQDVVWVGGGSVANLLAVWRVHKLDEYFREAWEAGVVLGGVSAGSICWHAGGTTDSYGPVLQPVTNGLGLLPYSNTPHYDSEELRRPTFQRLVADGTLPDGYATDDGVGLHFAGTELVEAVTDRPDTFAWKVERKDDGAVEETRIEPRLLV